MEKEPCLIHQEEQESRMEEKKSVNSMRRGFRKVLTPLLLISFAVGSHLGVHMARKAANDNPRLKAALKVGDLMDFTIGSPKHDNYYLWKLYYKEKYPYDWE